MNGQQAAPAYRIHQGETVLGVVWSNAVVNMDAWVRVTYDDGTSDTLRMDRFVTGSARTAQLISTVQTARHDGYVTEGLVFSDAPQRGQTYVVLYIAQGYNPGDVRMALCKGYVYASTPLVVGQQVEPGPAGGPGAITRVTKAATVLTAGIVILAAVPTGALWKWIAGIASYVATASVGTRSVAVRFRDASGNVFLKSNLLAPTAGQTVVAEFAENLGSEQTVILSNSASIETPSPDRGLPAGYDVILGDTSGTDNADTGALEAQVEEWVMPN